MLKEVIDRGRYRAGGVGVIGVQPADELASRHGEALVQRVRLPPIRR